METGGQERDHSNVINAYHTHHCQRGKEDDLISVNILIAISCFWPGRAEDKEVMECKR